MSDPFGDSLEKFYLSISCVNVDPINVVGAVNELEDHLTNYKSPDLSTINEIVKDCRKKSYHFIRKQYADKINELTRDCRKRLQSKAALDSDSAALHGHRHLNMLIDLLGTWSNIVSHATLDSNYHLSREMVQLVLQSPYKAMIEMCSECFAKFREDKELEQWTVKLLHASHEDINLNSLDSLVAQISTMRELLNQHYSFLFQSFLTLPVTTPAAFAPTQQPAQSTHSAQSASAKYLEGMLLVPSDELSQWKVLEGCYISLESGYLSRAVLEAFSDTCLLEIEDNVYIPQAVEDLFFLCCKCTERAASTGSEDCVFGVGNKILELLDSNDNQDSHNYSLLYSTVTQKSTFDGCVQNECISSRLIDSVFRAMETSIANKNKAKYNSSNGNNSNNSSSNGHSATSNSYSNSSNNNPMQTPLKQNSTSSLQSVSLSTSDSAPHTPSYTPSYSPLGQLIADGSNSLAESGLQGLITDVASVSLKGATSWLTGFASPYMTPIERNALGISAGDEDTGAGSSSDRHGGIAFSGRDGGKTPPPVPSASSFKPPLMNSTSASNTANQTNGNTNNGHSNGYSNGYSTPMSKSSNKNTMHKLSPPNSTSGAAGGLLSSTPIADLLNDLKREADAAPGSTDHFSDSHHQQYSDSGISHHHNSNPNSGSGRAVVLCEDDLVIQLNTLAMVASGIKTLQRTYTRIMNALNNRGGIGGTGSVLLPIVLQELSQCEKKYRAHLKIEIGQYSAQLYRSHLHSDISAFCTKSFDISGHEYDSRSSENTLMCILKRCLAPVEVTLSTTAPPSSTGSGGEADDNSSYRGSAVPVPPKKGDNKVYHIPYFLRHCATSLSAHALHHVLCELSGRIVQVLQEVVERSTFTEWGAMLLQQEVMAMVSYLESLVDSSEDCLALKACYEALSLSLKILTMEPRDITRFRIPARLLSETAVRKLFGRRSDFKKADQDAISTVRITLV